MNKKSVALFDFDKTIYKDFSIFTTTKYLVEKQILGAVVEAEMVELYVKYKMGLADYSQTANSLIELQAKAFAGMSYEPIREDLREFFESNRDKFFDYFEKILPKLKKTHEVILVTASFQAVAEVVTDMFKLDGYLSTKYEVRDGLFTGKVEESLVEGKEKVGDLLKNFGGDNIAMGDSESDIGMLEKVEIPICINPTEKLLERATKDGWLVVSDVDAYEKISEILSDKIDQ